jgi:hypothetical protein
MRAFAVANAQAQCETRFEEYRNDAELTYHFRRRRK